MKKEDIIKLIPPGHGIAQKGNFFYPYVPGNTIVSSYFTTMGGVLKYLRHRKPVMSARTLPNKQVSNEQYIIDTSDLSNPRHVEYFITDQAYEDYRLKSFLKWAEGDNRKLIVLKALNNSVLINSLRDNYWK